MCAYEPKVNLKTWTRIQLTHWLANRLNFPPKIKINLWYPANTLVEQNPKPPIFNMDERLSQNFTWRFRSTSIYFPKRWKTSYFCFASPSLRTKLKWERKSLFTAPHHTYVVKVYPNAKERRNPIKMWKTPKLQKIQKMLPNQQIRLFLLLNAFIHSWNKHWKTKTHFIAVQNKTVKTRHSIKSSFTKTNPKKQPKLLVKLHRTATILTIVIANRRHNSNVRRCLN